MEQKQLAQRLNHVKKYITISYLAQPVIFTKRKPPNSSSSHKRPLDILQKTPYHKPYIFL